MAFESGAVVVLWLWERVGQMLLAWKMADDWHRRREGGFLSRSGGCHGTVSGNGAAADRFGGVAAKKRCYEEDGSGIVILW